MSDAVLNEYIYPTTEIIHEGTCVFFTLGLPTEFFTITTG